MPEAKHDQAKHARPKFLILTRIMQMLALAAAAFIVFVNIMLMIDYGENTKSVDDIQLIMALISTIFNALLGLLIVIAVLQVPRFVIHLLLFLESWIGLGILCVYVAVNTFASRLRLSTFSFAMDEYASYCLMGVGALHIVLGLVGGQGRAAKLARREADRK